MFNNPFYYNPYYPQQQRLAQMEQQYPQFANNNNNNYMPQMNQQNQNVPQMQTVAQQSMGLQGKAVDSLDVVKATDVPLDGSITYFPKTDGTAIYTKQLQKDGTSKLTIYEVKEDTKEENSSKNDIRLLQKEDIEKIYKDISNVKISLEENMNILFDKFEDFKDEIKIKLKEEKKTSTSTRGSRK